MIWTEREAINKTCPVLPVDREEYEVDGCKRNAVRLHATCVASRCMMWRKVDQIGVGPNGEKRDRDMDGMTKWVDRGFCGLAGKPA